MSRNIWKLDDIETKKDVINFLSNSGGGHVVCRSMVSPDYNPENPCLIEFWIKMAGILSSKELERLLHLNIIEDHQEWSKIWIQIFEVLSNFDHKNLRRFNEKEMEQLSAPDAPFSNNRGYVDDFNKRIEYLEREGCYEI